VPRLADLVAVLDSWFSPSTADEWDRVGLGCGDPSAAVDHVLLAVDCVPDVVAQAVSARAQLLLTHHPLLLKGVHGVRADDPKTSMAYQLIRAGIAQFSAHTNADVAVGGVSDALAQLLGLLDAAPLQPRLGPALDQLTVYVPRSHLEPLIAALSATGAGALGQYEHCTFTVEGTGSYRAKPGARPFLGEVGQLTRTPETRLSMVAPRSRRSSVIAAMRAAHPYEEVAFELVEQARLPGATGSGRIGELATQTTLREFTELVARRLPKTAWGVRAAGDPDRPVRRVAVCGGAGGSYLELARAAGADLYLTADQRHHLVSEAVSEQPGADQMAVIDAAHWATEAPWLPVLAERLRGVFGAELRVTVSELVTDPWTLHRA
jgi:dinuclear metal center YbgI/SA1388 family protein